MNGGSGPNYSPLEKEPIELLRATPALLGELEEEMARGEEGELRGTLADLADFELVMGWRLRQTVASPGVHLSAYERSGWAARHERLHAALALDTFRALRAWNLALMTTFTLQDWLAEGFDTTHGFLSVDQMVRRMAANDVARLSELGIRLPAAP